MEMVDITLRQRYIVLCNQVQQEQSKISCICVFISPLALHQFLCARMRARCLHVCVVSSLFVIVFPDQLKHVLNNSFQVCGSLSFATILATKNALLGDARAPEHSI